MSQDEPKKYLDYVGLGVVVDRIKKLIGVTSVNDQTPTYTEATALTKLTSGEKLSVAFGKISKAITDLIAHISDTTKHITSVERNNWNLAKTHADSAHAPSNAQSNVIETVKVNGTALTPSSKAVNVTVPTKVSQLANDSGFKTADTWRPLGTGANDACAGNDSRLSNARPASDVYSWAKASSKPSYSWNEISGKPNIPSVYYTADWISLPVNGYCMLVRNGRERTLHFSHLSYEGTDWVYLFTLGETDLLKIEIFGLLSNTNNNEFSQIWIKVNGEVYIRQAYNWCDNSGTINWTSATA